MRVDSINLEYFRGFEQLDLRFEPDLTVIAGVNGVGKSGILHTLRSLFSYSLPEYTPCRTDKIYLTPDDIKHGFKKTSISLQFSEQNHYCTCGIQSFWDIDDKNSVWFSYWLHKGQDDHRKKSFEELLHDRDFSGNYDKSKKETEKILNALKSRSNQPFARLFTPARQLTGRPTTLPEIKAFEIANIYSFALQDRQVELRSFMHWFRVVESGVTEAHRQGKGVLNALRRVVSEFIPEFSNLRVEDKPRLSLMVDKNDTPLSLHQLSDGERGLLAMLFDITRRLWIANPDLDDPISEGSAVIMIDEIELHLHPKWQREVLRKFTKIYKNCQFIVTTHSPIVLGEVEARSVRFFRWNEENRVICETPENTYGLDANRILKYEMQVGERTAKVNSDLKRISDLIDQEDLEKAKTEIESLKNVIGANDPELIRASSLISFLEGDE